MECPRLVMRKGYPLTGLRLVNHLASPPKVTHLETLMAFLTVCLRSATRWGWRWENPMVSLPKEIQKVSQKGFRLVTPMVCQTVYPRSGNQMVTPKDWTTGWPTVSGLAWRWVCPRTVTLMGRPKGYAMVSRSDCRKVFLQTVRLMATQMVMHSAFPHSGS